MSNVLNIYLRCSRCHQILKKSLIVIVYKPRGQPEIAVAPCQGCLDEARSEGHRDRANEE